MTHLGALRPAQAAAAGAGAVVLQRKCACGSPASSLTDDCEGCRRGKTLGLQAKLAVGAANDPFEQEADRIAEGVLALPTPVREPLRGVPAPPGPRGDGEPDELAPFSDRGEPLSPAARAFFEPRFGHDFGRVRIHTGARAATLARDLDARAFTVGRSIGFAAGEFDPHGSAGRRLLAHELAHTIQQSGDVARVQRACAGLDAGFRARQQAPDPASDPCRSRNASDCCDELMGCDRPAAAESALGRARTKVRQAVDRLGKVVIGRDVRRLIRRLFGTRGFKKKALAKLREALVWLGGAKVARRGGGATAASKPSARRGEQQARSSAPDGPELPPDLEEAPLEDTPPTARPAPTVPPLRPPQPPVGDPHRATTGRTESAAPPEPCPETDKAILCALPCAGRCETGVLASTDGVVVRLCPSAFENAITLDGTLIHEAMHNVLSGKERDIYVQERLFAVLAQVRDPEGETGSIAQQNPDSYTALALAASGTAFEDLAEARGAPPPLRREGFGAHRRDRGAPEVALGFAAAGAGEAARQVEDLINQMAVASSVSGLPEPVRRTRDRLVRHGLLDASAPGADLAPEREHLRLIASRLERLRDLVNGAGEIRRDDSFAPASYAPPTLTVSKRFFALGSQRSQAQEVLEAFAATAPVPPSEEAAYVAFVAESIGEAEHLSSLPFGGGAQPQAEANGEGAPEGSDDE